VVVMMMMMMIMMLLMMMMTTTTSTTMMIRNFTLVFTLYYQDETKFSIETSFKIPFERFFYCIRNLEKQRRNSL
jgi:hypothetical protein